MPKQFRVRNNVIARRDALTANAPTSSFPPRSFQQVNTNDFIQLTLTPLTSEASQARRQASEPGRAKSVPA